VLTCSRTYGNIYWSSTTYYGNTFGAWTVLFSIASTSNVGKTNPGYVRAARGGL
jgi:hypothetical protein